MYVLRTSHYTDVTEMLENRRVPFYEQVYLNQLANLKNHNYFTRTSIKVPQGITLLRSAGTRLKNTAQPSLRMQRVGLEKVPGNLKTLREDLKSNKGDPQKRSAIAVDVSLGCYGSICDAISATALPISQKILWTSLPR
eukprot:TRINITY_DN15991_c0_g1_i27.p2 TRINITY_DN15991_c0_g1~~TRINITY_DN15991_c0_g1_i27.p2  ORF type:complete len:139 (+),score=14.08 TRINITY_DN15991_c0_g1_i27:492-908(+)